MSRYPDDGRYSNRWDKDRLVRERDSRDGYYEEYYGGPPPAVESPRRVSRAAPVAPVYEERRYYEDDRYGPRGAPMERRYFEEDEYYDPRTRGAQMVPYRPARPEAPPRPGILRRQSSLDTFDRAPPRRFEEYERPPPRSQRVDMLVPEPPGPRANRYRPPQRESLRREYDDIAIQDPDYYGDEGFREYREREWISSRRRDDPSPARSRAPTEIPEKIEETEIVIEKKEKKEEKPFPRRGKTKMPKRLVHTKVLFDLGYPYYEENDKTIVIEKALGPDNIDEIFVLSKEYRANEVGTTRLIEAPPPVTTTTKTTTIEIPAAPTIREPSPVPAESVREEKIIEEVITKPLSEAPRSVREWDGLTVESSRRSHSRRRSRSRHTRREHSPEVKQIIIEKRVSRSPSPARSRRRSRRSVVYGDSDDEIIERRIIRETDDFDESNSIHVGPLALVRDHPRSDREIRDEIEILRAERRSNQRDRRYSRDDEVLEIRRIESRSPSPPVKEMYIERRGDNMVLKREKSRTRSKSIVRPPSGREIRNMMYTLT